MIIYTRPDGGISVVTYTPEKEQEAFNALPSDAINPRITNDPAELPTDRIFRNAWVDTGKKIDHDISKCQAITKERLRIEREPLFAANDIKLQNALADGDDKAKAEAIVERDRLRNLTDIVNGVIDLQALKFVSISAVLVAAGVDV